MNSHPRGDEDTEYLGLHPNAQHDANDPSLFIPTEPPEPISLSIDLVPLEDLVDPIPEQDPRPESLFLDLNPLEALLPPVPEVVSDMPSMDIELMPEQETFPPSLTGPDRSSIGEGDHLPTASLKSWRTSSSNIFKSRRTSSSKWRTSSSNQSIGVGYQRSIDEILTPVVDATYTGSGPVAKCHPGTREDVIAKVVEWADKDNEHPICWLSGPAGYGKTAISYAIAERYDQEGRLVGSFFFLRGAGYRSFIACLVPTLSYQIYHHIPDTKASIQSAIDTDPSIAIQAPTYQFQKLIVEPLRVASNLSSVPAQMKPIIVIDALDECDDKISTEEFIEAVIDMFKENRDLPLRVLITSRVVEHIRQTFESSAARPSVHHLSLEDFDARRDIHAFFQYRLSAIYDNKRRVMGNLSHPWPSDSDLNSLVEKSGGSFLFAATLIDLIGQDSGLPQDNLCEALTAEGGLDSLYGQILANAPHDVNFKQVIGAVMLLTEPLPILFLAHLLQLRPEDIVQTLLGLQSILMIPGNDDHAIQLFHPSLRDFLISPRSGKHFIDPPACHLDIAANCLRVIEVRPGEDIFYRKDQMYACLNWCYHLKQGVMAGVNNPPNSPSIVSLMSCLTDFTSQSIDCWVNTSLYKGHSQLFILRSVILGLKHLPDLVQMLENIMHNVLMDLKDLASFLGFHDNFHPQDFDDFHKQDDNFIHNWRLSQQKKYLPFGLSTGSK